MSGDNDSMQLDVQDINMAWDAARAVPGNAAPARVVKEVVDRMCSDLMRTGKWPTHFRGVYGFVAGEIQFNLHKYAQNHLPDNVWKHGEDDLKGWLLTARLPPGDPTRAVDAYLWRTLHPVV